MPNENIVAVTPGGAITEDMLAGEYFWFSIPDAMMSLERVRKAWKAAGLDVDRLPKSRRPADVAAEAIRKVEHGPQRNGTIVETRVEQVVNTPSEIIYQVTRHVWDLEQRQINHPKAVRVVFEKARAELTFEPLDEGEEIEGIERDIRRHYEANGTKIPGHKLRTILRHYIEEVGAENMRGNAGAVYFFPRLNRQRDDSIVNGREFVGKVVEMLRLIYGTPEIHRVPCVNDEGQREYLERRFVENCDKDLESYRDKLLELLATKDQRTRGFRADMVSNLIDERSRMTERRAKFEAILGRTLGDLDTNMKLADQALQKFLAETPQIVAA